MPSVSQAQNRWAHWAENNSPNPKTRAAAADYVAADAGRKISKLPQHKKPADKAAPVFGALDARK
jgi:hypothetical protein